ncbi:hypothetical protein E2C01_018779 [Portunus trituberculatus]|uniref:Uncharacterized protein n=1 Tax=Portunus trituberculatus TaxID=210409 RepID=A0A5B7DXA9_PORTR|nr:hypothetical protein [Portunus trituberculatus]
MLRASRNSNNRLAPKNSEHRLIKRRDLPGYCPQSWCAVCGREATKTAPYVSCEGSSECRNVCHTACLGDRESYTCKDTQQLRQETSIVDEVVYISENPDLTFRPHSHTTTETKTKRGNTYCS